MTTDNTNRVWIAVYESYEDDGYEQSFGTAYRRKSDLIVAILAEEADNWDGDDETGFEYTAHLAGELERNGYAELTNADRVSEGQHGWGAVQLVELTIK